MHETCGHHNCGKWGMVHSFWRGVWDTYFPPVGDRLDLHTAIHFNYTTKPDKEAYILYSYILCDALQCMRHTGTTVMGNMGCLTPSAW